MKVNYKVSYQFVKLPDTAIGDFTDTIINALTGNTGFPNLPVALTVIETQKIDYLAKLAATAQGGTLATSAKNDAREVLLTYLRQTAAYVQTMASLDLTLLLSSGFQAVSTNRAQAQLAQPVILRIENGLTTQLVVRLQPIPNARTYEVRTSTNTGTSWQPAGISPQARRIEIDNLTPGTTYTVQVRAIGGSSGYSDWSVPASLMAT